MNEGIRKPTWTAPLKHPIAPQASDRQHHAEPAKIEGVAVVLHEQADQDRANRQNAFDRQIDAA